MARPLKKLPISTEKYIADLAACQCTQTEIARLLGISQDSFHDRFAAVYAKGREEGKTKLRTKLFQTALAGNVTALIFALKNYCGMSDRVQQEISGPNGQPLQVDAVRSGLEEKLDKLVAKKQKKDGDE